MLQKLVELIEPYMSGEPCGAESGSCELANCRTCDAIALANRLILHGFVPTVRCKDCKVPHNRWTGCPKLNGLIPPPDFYCAYCEWKDGEG